MNKRFIAIIPARSGSKGIKHKNIKDLNGKPLFHYTIEAALKSNYITDVIVTSDSKEYLEIANIDSNIKLHEREKCLSEDDTSTNDVLINIINNYKIKNTDFFVLLQPTSPLRNHHHIDEAIDSMLTKNNIAAISVSQSSESSHLMNVLNADLSMYNFISKDAMRRRQDFKREYVINGAIYISEVQSFKENKTYYIKKSNAYIMERKYSIDIDEDLDLIVAKSILDSEMQ